MPAFLWVFWVVTGLGCGSAVMTGEAPVWGGVDRINKTTKYQHDEAFIMHSNYPWEAIALTQNRRGEWVCPVTITVTAPRRVRLIYNDHEQNLDSGWTFEMELLEGKRFHYTAVFVDPVTRKILAERQTVVSCYPSGIVPTRNQILYDERGLRGYEPPCNCPCCKQEEKW